MGKISGAYSRKQMLRDIARFENAIPDTRLKRFEMAGVTSAITKDLRAGIVDAAAAHGADGKGAGGLTGYLFLLASEHPKTFAGLLVKLLPMQVQQSGRGQSNIGTVNIVSVPADRYLSADDLRKIGATNPDSAPALDLQALGDSIAASVDADSDDSAGS